MDILIHVFGSLFEAFLIYLFFTGILKERRVWVNPFLMCIFLALGEVLLYVNTVLFTGDTSVAKQIITIMVNLLVVFSISNLYHASFLHRLFSSLLYVIIGIFCEELFAFCFFHTHIPEEIYDSNLLDAIISTGAGLFQLIIIISILIVWKRNKDNYTLHYNFLIFTTPVLTVLVHIFLPTSVIVDHEMMAFFTLFLICIIVINIVNYIMLDNVLKLANVRLRYTTEQQLTQIQQQRYEQLSTAYKNTRSIVHDVKEHYFYIDGCLNRGDYDAARSHMQKLVSNLENSYARINTGNLVIDTLVSNYLSLAEAEKIPFHTKIRINKIHIPIDEYDLCVVLGNLLENSLQACKQHPDSKKCFMELIIVSTEDTFVIRLKNTLIEKSSLEKKELWNLYHGYGLNNVTKIVEGKYEGIFQVSISDYYEASASIPIK